jgi:ribosomal-protein-alanine N-acetyltransferase
MADTELEILGSEVALRPMRPSDLTAAYIGWLNDPAVVRFSNQRFKTHTHDSVAAYLASFVGTANHFLSIRSLNDDQPIGTMTAYLAMPHGTADMGIMLGDSRFWGKGLGRDAWRSLMDFLLVQKHLRKVTGGTLRCNTGMVCIMEQTGMSLEGVRSAQEIVEGTPQDVLYFARFADR